MVNNGMKNSEGWLLCDFHIHTSMSDGKLFLREVVDLYEKSNVEVISITDHAIDRYTLSKRLKENTPVNAIMEKDFQVYLKELWREQKKAWGV